MECEPVMSWQGERVEQKHGGNVKSSKTKEVQESARTALSVVEET